MTVSSQPSAPNPFEGQTDVGIVHHPGSCVYDPEQQVYTVTGAGANIWGDHDDFHFVWRRIPGDFMVTTRAEFSGAGVNPHRKLGWMARASLHTSSPQVCTGIHGDGLVSLQFRRKQGGLTEELRAPVNGTDVIQLERKANSYILSVARNSEPFTVVQVDEIDMGEEVYVGLFVCAHEDEVLEKASFQNVRIVALV